jgi:hypothetical protein
MARKILLEGGTGSVLLEETLAENEAQLQELLKNNPTLLPIEDFELSGPLMVVGRETSLGSGSVDLVCLARTGDILIIEFKTGTGNPDFRHAAAQLLDYGSHLWSLSFEEFENVVPLRYFASERCPKDSPTWRKSSLHEAAISMWPGLVDEDWRALRHKVEDQLKTGAFRYVLAAQTFHTSMERTLAYLSGAMTGSRFYSIELVRFDGDGMTAFEARTVIRPEQSRASERERVIQYEERFLEQIDDAKYRNVLERLFDTCRALDLRFEWGSLGVSIRLPTRDRAEPLTVAWVFPPGVKGWSGLTDVTLGFDLGSVQKTPSVSDAVDGYVRSAEKIDGAAAVKAQNVRGFSFEPSAVIRNYQRTLEVITNLVAWVNAGNQSV